MALQIGRFVEKIRLFVEFIFICLHIVLFLLSTLKKHLTMKTVTTNREGRLCYVAPLLEQIDVQAEKGFATSDYPGTGGTSPMSSYDDYYETE